MLGQPAMLRPVSQEVDDEDAGRFYGLGQIGVGADQAEQAARLALGEHQGRHREPHRTGLAGGPHGDRGGQPGPGSADRVALAGRICPRVPVAA